MYKITPFLLIILSFNLFSQSGDSCDQAIDISAGDYYIETISGNIGSNLSNCTEINGNPENLKWFSYTAAEDVFVNVTSDLESNTPEDDTRLHIYEGSCDNLICIAGNDDSGGLYNGFLSTTAFEAIAGSTYYIAWDNYWSNTSFDFQVVESNEPPPPLYVTFMHNNLEREYIFYEPEGLETNSPLVFVMHGYTEDAINIRNYSNMNDIADQYRFAVCYPRGTVDNFGNRFWNVGYDFHPNETVDDVDFLKELASHLHDSYNLNSEKTFATGMSNGGEMCYMLACQATETFRAVAPVSGMMLQEIIDSCVPSNLISIFEIHGVNDNVNYYNGDPLSSGGWGAYPSIPFTIEYWAELNNCTEFYSEQLSDINSSDGSYVVSEKNYGAANNNEVWLYKIFGGGHDWPGTAGSNMDINASLEVWLFFEHIMASSLGFESVGSNNNYLYPNPASDYFSISNSNTELKYEIYNISAQSILIGKNPTNIDVRNLKKGIYFVNITHKNQTFIKKLIIK